MSNAENGRHVILDEIKLCYGSASEQLAILGLDFPPLLWRGKGQGLCFLLTGTLAGTCLLGTCAERWYFFDHSCARISQKCVAKAFKSSSSTSTLQWSAAAILHKCLKDLQNGGRCNICARIQSWHFFVGWWGVLEQWGTWDFAYLFGWPQSAPATSGAPKLRELSKVFASTLEL